MIRTIYLWKFTNRVLRLKDVPCFELRFYKSKLILSINFTQSLIKYKLRFRK